MDRMVSASTVWLKVGPGGWMGVGEVYQVYDVFVETI